MTTIEGEGYKVRLEDSGARVIFEGALRLGSASAYRPIANLLGEALERGESQVTLDFGKLVALNSRGFGTLARFVLDGKKRGDLQIILLGNSAHHWQPRSLSTLQKLWPTVELQLIEAT
ncbi:MAG: hypothetical protein R3A51_04015 [Nannocystaceae bacterium]|nr:hypothetical protein [Myxococcales bacterium]